MQLDLGRLSSVRHFVKEWGARGLPLHLLVCNAGIMGPPRRLETADGLEMQFQVNFLSHWLLANELLSRERERRMAVAAAAATAHSSSSSMRPASAAESASTGSKPAAKCRFRRARRRCDKAHVHVTCSSGSLPCPAASASPASPTSCAPGTSGLVSLSGVDLCDGGAAAATKAGGGDEGMRVVMVTSLTHRAGALQWGDKQSRRSYEPFVSYGLSKLANIITAKELQRRFDRSPPEYGKDT
ncbi:hypothetical protein Agub_g11303, partial [Astrephomene gubernaculifera]